MKKKTTIALMAFALALCFAIGGTLAWLVDETDPVVNTFTYGDINITLTESDDLDLKMVPGNNIEKDPTVAVEAGSEACWLFVQVEKSKNFDDFMTYTIGTNVDGKVWTQLTDQDGNAVEGVYYIEVSATDAEKGVEYGVLLNNIVVVKEDVTKEELVAFDTNKDGELSEEESKGLPTLTFTAYAVQKDNRTVEQAWEAVAKPDDATIND